MKDFTQVFDHYRISARGIWNTAFWPDPDCRTGDSIDRFQEITRILFSELVLSKVNADCTAHDIFQKPMTFFQIQPASQTIPILIRNPRPGDANGYWDHPINQISRGQAVLHFCEYFDWNEMSYVDFQYYLVRIAMFDGQPELVGRDALIETKCARVFLDE